MDFLFNKQLLLFFLWYLMHISTAGKADEIPLENAPSGTILSCKKCSFEKSDLQGYAFAAKQFTFSNFKEAKLNGADFSGADLRFTEFEKAILDGANLAEVDFTGARVRHVSFKESNCEKAKMVYTDLFRADFKSANLRKANMNGTNLLFADFTNADLTYADLTGAHTAEAVFKGALLCDTTMPDGYKFVGCEKKSMQRVDPKAFKPKPNFPKRAKKALTGSQFRNLIRSMNIEHREEAILNQLLAGNIPGHLRTLKPIYLDFYLKKEVIRGVIWIIPDYLAIGSDEDFIRIPMNPLTAKKVADKYGLALPTRKVVDAIYMQADLQLEPVYFPWGKQMRSNRYFFNHNMAIDELIGDRSLKNIILAGHKKDIIISARLLERKNRVAIYGWHRRHGSPVQPISIIHHNKYADYSHGIRFISQTMLVNGQIYTYHQVLTHPIFCELISDEGPITEPHFYTFSNKH